ncbi:MAG: transglycosylase SLT domain-containing protein [Deltaproteobacteria bacterium]|nr:transglycosylase SLT domain-containing protein [Deltaproteobacteria bacterium]
MTLIKYFLIAQLLIIICYMLVRVLSLLRVAPTTMVSVSRTMWIFVWIVPLFGAFFPTTVPYDSPAQLWAATNAKTAAVVEIGQQQFHAPSAGVFSNTNLDSSTLFLGFWAIGVAFFSFRSFRQWLVIRKMVEDSIVIKSIGRIKIRVADNCIPFSFRLLDEAVVMIDSNSVASGGRDYKVAIRHELQHHRQGDTWFAYIIQIICIVSFINPAVYAWRRLQALFDEICCDSSLIERKVVSPKAYGACLLDMSNRFASKTFCIAGLTQMSAKSSFLKRRINMLVLKNSRWKRAAPLISILSVLWLLFVTFACDAFVEDNRISKEDIEIAAKGLESELHVVTIPKLTKRVNEFAGTDKGRVFFKTALGNKERFETIIEAGLEKYDLPIFLSAIALVESGFENLDATKNTKADTAGIWQLSKNVAQQYNLRVDKTNDDRLDIAKETDAALRLLSDLHKRFGDWGLAIAAYNQGPEFIQKAIELHRTKSVWELMQKKIINDYAAGVVAAVLVMKNTEWLN